MPGIEVAISKPIEPAAKPSSSQGNKYPVYPKNIVVISKITPSIQFTSLGFL